MPTWIVRSVRGGAWDPVVGMREQRLWDEHAAFMERLVDDGVVLLGGPLYGDGTALLVVDAGSADEVESRLAADPWKAADLLRTLDVRRWEVLLRGRPV